jgi:hypothetical protein
MLYISSILGYGVYLASLDAKIYILDQRILVCPFHEYDIPHIHVEASKHYTVDIKGHISTSTLSIKYALITNVSLHCLAMLQISCQLIYRQWFKKKLIRKISKNIDKLKKILKYSFFSYKKNLKQYPSSTVFIGKGNIE